MSILAQRSENVYTLPMTFQTFDSLDELFAQMEHSRNAANARVVPWQEKLAPGDFFLQFNTNIGVFIWGEVLDAVAAERAAGASEEELAAVIESQNDPNTKHYRFCRAFSEMCPQGELGSVHVSVMLAKVPRAAFEHAKAQRWSPRSVLPALQLGETTPPRHTLLPDFFQPVS